MQNFQARVKSAVRTWRKNIRSCLWGWDSKCQGDHSCKDMEKKSWRVRKLARFGFVGAKCHWARQWRVKILGKLAWTQLGRICFFGKIMFWNIMLIFHPSSDILAYLDFKYIVFSMFIIQRRILRHKARICWESQLLL